MYLIEESDVQGEPEAICEVDFVCQSVAKLAGCGGRVRQESLGGSIHERDRQHDWLL